MIDSLIIGQGLAGSLLGYALHQKGWQIKIVDRPEPQSSSRVAAGLINPVTGKRWALSWQIDALLPLALTYYKTLENFFGQPFIHKLQGFRLFSDSTDVQIFNKKLSKEAFKPYLRTLSHSFPFNPHEAAAIEGMHQLDIPLLLDTLARYFKKRELLTHTTLDFTELCFFSSHCSWKGLKTRFIIDCSGVAAANNPYWTFLPFKPAAGDILTVNNTGPLERLQWLHSPQAWFLRTLEGTLKIGGSYRWEGIHAHPCPKVRTSLLEAHEKYFHQKAGSVLQHQAAVRPCTEDALPFLGPHPTHSCLYMLNGLGSKGSLFAPYAVQCLLEHFFDQKPLPEAWSLLRYAHKNRLHS